MRTSNYEDLPSSTLTLYQLRTPLLRNTSFLKDLPLEALPGMYGSTPDKFQIRSLGTSQLVPHGNDLAFNCVRRSCDFVAWMEERLCKTLKSMH
ncbi:hypothetical protein CHUAL_011059 [Chamberlinius hualienensis]